MDNEHLKANALLLLTAAIWGFAFVAQRKGMEYIGPFTFNAVRFTLGGLSLVPLLKTRRFSNRPSRTIAPQSVSRRQLLFRSLVVGTVLFLGSSLQQFGIVYTTAGKAGFITGLYVVIVPLMGLFRRQSTSKSAWLGAILAAIGLYLISITGNFQVALGDLLVFLSAFFWAAHVQVLSIYSPKTDAIRLSIGQFLICALFSLIGALLVETMLWRPILQAAIPILYAGLLSVGIAYTLQVVGQQKAHPAHAAIILSLESVFAVLGGWILLGETLSTRGIIGCALMLGGMLISQMRLPHRHLKQPA